VKQQIKVRRPLHWLSYPSCFTQGLRPGLYAAARLRGLKPNATLYRTIAGFTGCSYNPARLDLPGTTKAERAKMESSPIVFISYSHDSDEHRARVLALSERLRKDGIETRLDQYLNGAPPETWPRWMLNQLDEASFVLVVCTETYYRRFRGKEVPGKGKGVDWEGALITQELYDARRETLKFVPVLFEADHEPHVPEPLRGLNHYQPLTRRGYEALYDFLLGQAGVEPSAVGELKRKPRTKGQPLTFNDPIIPESLAPNPPSIKVSLPPPLTPHLFGRDDELQLLDEAWASPSTNIIVFHALGGAGKSALVSKWLARMAANNYDGARRVFGWSFFSQGSSENRSDSSEAFIDSALAFFGVTVEGDYFRKADRLAEALRAERTVLVLDGVEPLQYPPNTAGLPEGGLKDRALQTILLQLAAQQPGLCIITSRERLSDLNGYDEATVIQRPLDHLPYQTATGEQPCAQLLRALGVDGDDAEMLAAAQEFKGHAYGLTLLGSYVAEVLGGDLRRRKDIANLFDDDRFGSQADRMIAAYETWLGDGVEVAILRLLGLFDRPAEAASIAALRAAPALLGLTETLQGLSEVKWQQALSKLRRLNLLSPANPHAPCELDAHPLVREHFRQQLKTHAPDAWRAGNLRLYEHLTCTAKDLPDTLAEMQPLFAAVTHGCAAGKYEEAFSDVYKARIHREEEYFNIDKLGAFGAELAMLSSFFVTPWQVPIDKIPLEAKAFVLNEAGICLRAIGRLTEAVQPIKNGLTLNTDLCDWKNVAFSAGCISQLLLYAGELPEAVQFAEQSVETADRSGDLYMKITNRTKLAESLHQAGRLEEALAVFQEAEDMQIKQAPSATGFYSVHSFRYCELLLDLGEVQSVIDRATQSLEISQCNGWLLSLALDNLALGRANLLLGQRIDNIRTGLATSLAYPLEQSFSPTPNITISLVTNAHLTRSHSYLQSALDRLRESGRSDHLPIGLLARAAWARMAQQFDLAQRDLAEARAIAERGEMRLHMTDYHLESARLALAQLDGTGSVSSLGDASEEEGAGRPGSPFRTELLAQARDHYDKARQLIAETGYHRRDGELKELEEQLG
jgi:tetratricopeptide (TPR) repeat protein